MYALVSFLDFFRLARPLPGVDIIVFELLASGESRSRLGPPEGVLEPVRDGDWSGDSLTIEESVSVGEATRALSCPVTASDIALRPKCLLEIGLTGKSQSDPRPGRASGDFGMFVVS